MPHSLQAQFTLYSLEEQEKRHQWCDFQFGGIYCISTNESRHWRPKYGHCPIAFKVGKTWDCLSRLNQYLTYSPFSRGGGGPPPLFCHHGPSHKRPETGHFSDRIVCAGRAPKKISCGQMAWSGRRMAPPLLLRVDPVPCGGNRGSVQKSLREGQSLCRLQ